MIPADVSRRAWSPDSLCTTAPLMSHVNVPLVEGWMSTNTTDATASGGLECFPASADGAIRAGAATAIAPPMNCSARLRDTVTFLKPFARSPMKCSLIIRPFPDPIVPVRIASDDPQRPSILPSAPIRALTMGTGDLRPLGQHGLGSSRYRPSCGATTGATNNAPQRATRGLAGENQDPTAQRRSRARAGRQ